jgi:putative oxidoreductase
MAIPVKLAPLYKLDALANALQSPFALAVRVYVSWVFLKSGWLKLQDWEQTVALFESEYRVPLLSPLAAAIAGTAGEIVFPVLLILGFGGRLVPLGLFAVNALAVFSYGHWFFTDAGIAGLRQHQLWGFMLAMLVIYGVGNWSVDGWMKKK